MNFSIIGGDARQLYLASLLSNKGHRVRLWGFEGCEGPLPCPRFPLKDALADADAVILPYPALTASGQINAPLARSGITPAAILADLPRGAAVFGGRLPERFISDCAARGCECSDYSLREELTVANAVPSAEGAVQIALSELPCTLNSCRSLVIGYGRIGKLLSELLSGFGGGVTVAARKPSDLALARARGFETVCSEPLEGLKGFRVIFNTVPYPLIDRRLIDGCDGGTVIIDLASDPGGIVPDAAVGSGVRVIRALGLPGRFSPQTAAGIILETVENMLRERSVNIR